MDTQTILEKWYVAKEKISQLEKKIEKYKSAISKELNKKETDKLTIGGYTVTRRRTTRTTLSKNNVPETIWKEYATKCHYDTFILTKK